RRPLHVIPPFGEAFCSATGRNSAAGRNLEDSICRRNSSNWPWIAGPTILAVSRLDITFSTTYLALLSMHVISTSHSPCFSFILTSSPGWSLMLIYTPQHAIDKSVADHIVHVAQY